MHTKFRFLIAIISVLWLMGTACSDGQQETVEQSEVSAPPKSSFVNRIEAVAMTSQTLPALMKSLTEAHLEHFMARDNGGYKTICASYQLDSSHPDNQRNYVLFLLTHKLLTAEGASTGSMGKILKIPYFWHYTTPNPRHNILLISSGELLRNTPPPSEFKQYLNFAGIDRTPFLYLSDAFAETPPYFSAQCDTFSSFGWCSEREMAYNALLKTLGFNGKIYTMGIHCWSEFLVPMQTLSGEQIKLDLKVDNTYDLMQWRSPITKSLSEWEQDLGTIKERYWYNKKASDPKELNRIKSFVVSQAKCEEVERKMVEYLNQQEAIDRKEH